MSINSLLIANRGEIAVRIIRAAKELGIHTVQVYSDADASSLAVQLADESFNIVSNNELIKDQIASSIYYKDIGSRTGLTVAESDIAYAGSSDTVKNVYTNKAITDIRKLVTEGYVKIERGTQDVQIVTEKAGL